MPVYKGTTEITSGKLYKGATNIENGYKEIDPFYVNETTVSFATPTGQGFSYTTPSPQSSTGVPGSAFPSTTFVISGGSQAISGTAAVSGLPSTLSVTNQSYIGSGPGNSLTITIGGTFPTTSSLNTALTISGLSTVTYYTVSLNYNGLTSPAGANSVSISGSISGTGAINVTNTGGVWSGQFPAGTSITAIASYSVSQSGAGGNATSFRQNYFTGSYSGGSFSISSPFTMSGGAPGQSTSHSVSSSSTTLNGNASYSISGGYSVLSSSNWGFDIPTPPATAPRLTAIIVGGVNSVGGYNVVSRQAHLQGGGALVYMNPPGGTFQFGGVIGYTPAGGNVTQMQIQRTTAGSTSFSITWGEGTLNWTTVFT
jgi:hypothetical protein